MNIKTVEVGAFRSNAYLITGEASRAFLVDAGADYLKIKKAAADLKVKIEAVLLTHGHFDHINAAKFFQAEGAQVIIHRDDADKLYTYKNYGVFFDEKINKLKADMTLIGGETLSIAGIKVKVIHTPGHSAGSVCYLAEDALFTGDTLFKLDFGRTDFHDGSMEKLINCIYNKIFNLKGNYKIYPGHGEPSELDFERRGNPIKYELKSNR
ncbi:MAG TPA: MBL fold metallo-hydrolase [Eubacteriales bacterium]|jgi:glyoxylase-like metal-dependent hydrolase (beta-lactamase superfamily II)|nr:MBL fold metallo-hydrolase [Clostridia bacterium]HRR90516.1 MBL fold metallo-hydrolase [Eubacteriales bacterium]HRU84142.1 MBL fold metallo-hydrolase [Eubacteriales bacterium]